MNKATVIKVDGSVQELDHQPTLKEAQGIVGGYIESLKARDDKTNLSVTLLVNEDGRMLKLPCNLDVSIWYSLKGLRGSYHFPLVGNVIVLHGWKGVCS